VRAAADRDARANGWRVLPLARPASRVGGRLDRARDGDVEARPQALRIGGHVTKYLRLFRIQMGISVAQAFAYRANFLIEGVFGIANGFLALVPLIVVYESRKSFGGWDYPSALVVMAYFQA